MPIVRQSHSGMPGSFFSRSPSLEPSSRHYGEKPRVVRFATDAISSPAKRTPQLSKAPTKSRPQTPRSRGDERQMPSSSDEESLHMETPLRSKRRNDSNTAQQASVNSEASPSLQNKVPSVKGKGREILEVSEDECSSSGSDEIHEEDDIGEEDINARGPEASFRTQVKNKEYELHIARQKERDHNAANGDDDVKGDDDDERLRDKNKIRALEEEIKRLQDEVLSLCYVLSVIY